MDLSRVNFIYLFGITFILYAAASIIWAYDSEAVYLFIKFLILAQVFVLGSYLENLKDVFKGLALGITVSSTFVLFGIKGGLFINPNTLSETAALILIGLCVYKLWWYIPGLLPSILIDGSRAAFLALGLTFSIWFLNVCRYYYK